MAGVTYPRQGWSDYVIENEDCVFRLAPQKPVIGGLYRHFKGGIYQVLTFARDEANRDIELVIYRSIKDGSVWAREIGLFQSDVDAEKYPEFAGQKRLEYIGRPQYTQLV